MTLEEKFEHIARGGGILKEPFPLTWADSVEIFWNDFVVPRLPERETVIAWHKILMDYIHRPDAVFALRIYNENNENLIRRGLFTKIENDDYSYFNTDNSFAYYFARIVLDGDCIPSPEEFFNFCHNRRIPYKYKIRGNLETESHYANAFPSSTKNPWITKYHKLAHLYSVGENFKWSDGEVLNIADIAASYFPRGVLSEWQLSGTGADQYYVRKKLVNPTDKEKAKKLMIAQFLRFVHPMNYFLAPKGPTQGRYYNRYMTTDGDSANDIGEYEPLLRFVKKKFHERYTIDGHDYYQEFLDCILAENDESEEMGEMYIEVAYSSDPLPFGVYTITEQTEPQPRRTPNNHEGQPRVRGARGESPEIELVPSDVARFKSILLRTHSAQRTWFYGDGTSRTENWNASNFRETSDVMANIRTTAVYRKWRENGLTKVKLVVEEF